MIGSSPQEIDKMVYQAEVEAHRPGCLVFGFKTPIYRYGIGHMCSNTAVHSFGLHQLEGAGVSAGLHLKFDCFQLAPF